MCYERDDLPDLPAIVGESSEGNAFSPRRKQSRDAPQYGIHARPIYRPTKKSYMDDSWNKENVDVTRASRNSVSRNHEYTNNVPSHSELKINYSQNQYNDNYGSYFAENNINNSYNQNQYSTNSVPNIYRTETYSDHKADNSYIQNHSNSGSYLAEQKMKNKSQIKREYHNYEYPDYTNPVAHFSGHKVDFQNGVFIFIWFFTPWYGKCYGNPLLLMHLWAQTIAVETVL